MDIPRYRIGNDLTVLWAISNNDGTPYDLSGKEVRLYVTNERGISRVEPTIEQGDNSSVTNIIRWVFLGDNQKVLGKHTLTVEILTSDEHRKIKRDICDAFTLVSRSEEEETGGEGNALDSGAIYLSTKLDVYRFGNVRVEIGTNGNWFIDGTDTGRSAMGGGPGLVHNIFNVDDLGKEFVKDSVIDTFNAYTINEIYKSLQNISFRDLAGLDLKDLDECDVIAYNGESWVNIPFQTLLAIYGGGNSGGGGSGDSHWYLGNDGKLHTDYDIVVHGNAIIEGDTSSGGEGEDITVGLDEQAVLDLLEREKYVTEDDIAGLVPEVDLSDYYKATQVDDLLLKKANTENVYTKEELNPYKAWWDKVMAHLTVDADGNVVIDPNLIVSGDTASGGEGEDITVGLDEQAVLDLLEEKGYVTEEDIAGLIPDDYVNSAELTEIVNEINAKIEKKANSSALQNLQNEVDNIEAVLGMDEKAEGVINTWNEVKAFLDGYSSSDDLATILSSMNADIAKRALKSELEALGLIVNGHTSSISTINGSINAINGSINALSGKVGTNESNISNLLTRMSAEETVTNTYKDWWYELKPLIVKDASGNIVIKTNLIVEGDTASLASGTDEPSGSGGITLTDVAGYLNANDYVNADNAEELGMATQEWVNNKKYATGITVNGTTLYPTNGIINIGTISGGSDESILEGVFKGTINGYKEGEFYTPTASSAVSEKQVLVNSKVDGPMAPFKWKSLSTISLQEFKNETQSTSYFINQEDLNNYDNTIKQWVKEQIYSGDYDSLLYFYTNNDGYGILELGDPVHETVDYIYLTSNIGVEVSGYLHFENSYGSGLYIYGDYIYFGDINDSYCPHLYYNNRNLHFSRKKDLSGGGAVQENCVILHSENWSDYISAEGISSETLNSWSGSTNLVTVGKLKGASLGFESTNSAQSLINLYTSDSTVAKTIVGYYENLGGSILYDISKDTWINIAQDNLYISNRYKVLHSGNYTDYLSGGSSADLSAYLTIDDAASTYLPLTGGVIKTSALVPLTIQSTGSVFTLQLVNSITNALGSTVGIKAQMRTISLVNGDYQLTLNSAGSLKLNDNRILTTADLDDIGGGSGITADTLLETAIDVGAASTRYYLSEISDVRDKFGGIPSNTVFELNSYAQKLNLGGFLPAEGSNGVMYIVQGLTNASSVLSIPEKSKSAIMLVAYSSDSGTTTKQFNYSIVNQGSTSLVKIMGYFVLRLVYSYQQDLWIGTLL